MMKVQSVAEHSFRVAAIAYDLAEHCRDVDVNAKFKIAWLGIMHDVSEAVTGDLPGNFKAVLKNLNSGDRINAAAAVLQPWIWAVPGPAVPDVYVLILKYADTIEALIQYNHYAIRSNADVYSSLVQAVAAAGDRLPEAVRLRGQEILSLLMSDGSQEEANGKAEGSTQGGSPAGSPGSQVPGRRDPQAYPRSVQAPEGEGRGTGSGGTDPAV